MRNPVLCRCIEIILEAFRLPDETNDRCQVIAWKNMEGKLPAL
jgi:hypothetical protein